MSVAPAPSRSIRSELREPLAFGSTTCGAVIRIPDVLVLHVNRWSGSSAFPGVLVATGHADSIRQGAESGSSSVTSRSTQPRTSYAPIPIDSGRRTPSRSVCVSATQPGLA